MQNFIEDLVHHAREDIKNKAFIKTETGHSLDLTEIRDIVKQSLQALKAHMIQEFESRLPEEKDILVTKRPLTQGGGYPSINNIGFNECRSIIIEEINKLKQ